MDGARSFARLAEEKHAREEKNEFAHVRSHQYIYILFIRIRVFNRLRVSSLVGGTVKIKARSAKMSVAERRGIFFSSHRTLTQIFLTLKTIRIIQGENILTKT